MKFFYILTQSISSKYFYGEVIGGKHPIGYGFLAKVQVLVALFITILISIQVSVLLPTLEQKVVQLLPDEAEIILKDGVLQSNINPISIPFSDEYASKSVQRGAERNIYIPKHFFVIDTTASSTESDFKAKDTYMLITRDSIVYGQMNEQIARYDFVDIKDIELVIDKQILEEKVLIFKQYVKYVPFILFVVLWAIFYIMALATAFIYAVFIFIMFKLMKIGKGFREAFAVAVYSRGFALILGVFALILPLLMIPTLSILVQILFITLMIRPARLKNII